MTRSNSASNFALYRSNHESVNHTFVNAECCWTSLTHAICGDAGPWELGSSARVVDQRGTGEGVGVGDRVIACGSGWGAEVVAVRLRDALTIVRAAAIADVDVISVVDGEVALLDLGAPQLGVAGGEAEILGGCLVALDVDPGTSGDEAFKEILSQLQKILERSSSRITLLGDQELLGVVAWTEVDAGGHATLLTESDDVNLRGERHVLVDGEEFGVGVLQERQEDDHIRYNCT